MRRFIRKVSWNASNVVGGFRRLQYIQKAANETVNNSATLQDDNDLLAALAANETVVFDCLIRHTGNGTADFQCAFTVPAGCSILWNTSSGLLYNASDAVVISAETNVSGTSKTFGGATSTRTVVLHGLATNGGTAGNLQLQWAQATATVVDTIVEAGSSLRVWRV